MPIQTPHLPPSNRTLAHPPPHRAHFPAPSPAIPKGPLDRLTDVPPPSPELLDAPSEALVGVLALAEGGDGFVAELDDFEGQGGGGEEEVVCDGGVEEGGLGDGGDEGEVEVVDC